MKGGTHFTPRIEARGRVQSSGGSPPLDGGRGLRSPAAIDDGGTVIAQGSSLLEFLHRLETEPQGVDISDYSDEFCEGFLAGQRHIVEEIVAERVEVPDA